MQLGSDGTVLHEHAPATLCTQAALLTHSYASQAAPGEAGVQEQGLRALGLLCFGADAAAAARKRQAAERVHRMCTACAPRRVCAACAPHAHRMCAA